MVDAAPLKPLHPDESLSSAKLEALRALPTEQIVASLAPGVRDGLKTRPDGTILDGHHRVLVLRERGVVVDRLPRTVQQREDR